MLKCQHFFDVLKKHKVNFYCGVPDSLLKEMCAYLNQPDFVDSHITTANEGNAVALAAGYHLATGRYGMVYMQNSGQGNAFNPLASLTHEKVYQIPMLLVIGWRGEPDVADEPQHRHQGTITLETLEILNIPYSVVTPENTEVDMEVEKAVNWFENHKTPYALVIKKDSFEPIDKKIVLPSVGEVTREQAIGTILKMLDPDDVVVATTGKIGREIYEWRDAHQMTHETDFLNVGSMGHASSIALGIALASPKCNVICFDGDGAVMMHMGAMTTIGKQKPTNLMHIVLNNHCHESVGGQPTANADIDLIKIAQACGYPFAKSVSTVAEIVKAVNGFKNKQTLNLIEIQVKPGSRSDLGRPKESPKENKLSFMKKLEHRYDSE